MSDDENNNNGAPSNQPTPSVYKPRKPTMGGVKQIGSDAWVAWTGGKPNKGWKGLEDPNPTCIEPTMFRSESIGTSAKSRAYRVTGLEPKLSKTPDNLQIYEKKMFEHMKLHGMDTVTYLPSPSGSSDLVCVLTDHGQYDLKQGVTDANTFKKDKYDDYDKRNDKDATSFLLASCDTEMEKQLYEYCNREKDSFCAHWLQAMHIIHSVSLHRFEAVKLRMQRRKPLDYEKQNIETMSSDLLNDYNELHNARMYDYNISLVCMTNVMKAGGRSNMEFVSELRPVRRQLEDALKKIRHLSYDDAGAVLTNKDLDFLSLLNLWKTEYRRLEDTDEWHPSKQTSDSKALPRTFGHINSAKLKDGHECEKLVAAALKSIMDKKGIKPKKGPTKSNGSKGNPRTSNKKLRGREGRERRKTRTLDHPAPKPGEPETKTVNGVKWHWCAKCGDHGTWRIGHSTATHKSLEQLRAERTAKQSTNGAAANMLRAHFDYSPAAYRMVVRAQPQQRAYTASLLKWFMIGLFGIACTLLTKSHITWPSIDWMSIALYLNKAFANTLSLFSANRIGLAATALSGVTGFGTAAFVYAQCPDASKDHSSSFRVRRSPTVAKQARRRFRKEQKKSQPRFATRRKNDGCTVRLTLKDESKRNDKTFHPRFNNLPRSRRYEPPLIRRIRYLRKQLDDIDERIRALMKELEQCRSDRNRYFKELVKHSQSYKATTQFHAFGVPADLRGRTRHGASASLINPTCSLRDYLKDLSPLSRKLALQRPGMLTPEGPYPRDSTRADESRWTRAMSTEMDNLERLKVWEHCAQPTKHGKWTHKSKPKAPARYKSRGRLPGSSDNTHVSPHGDVTSLPDRIYQSENGQGHWQPRSSPGRKLTCWGSLLYSPKRCTHCHPRDTPPTTQSSCSSPSTPRSPTVQRSDPYLPHRTYSKSDNWMCPASVKPRNDSMKRAKVKQEVNTVDVSDAFIQSKLASPQRNKPKHYKSSPITPKRDTSKRDNSKRIASSSPKSTANCVPDPVVSNNSPFCFTMQWSSPKSFLTKLINLSRISSSHRGEEDADDHVLFDSGANCSCTFDKADFVSDIEDVPANSTVEGIGSGVKIEGRGIVAWTFVAENGMYRTLRLPCYYIPTVTQRIASLSSVMDSYPEESIVMSGGKMIMSGSKSVPRLSVEMNHLNLPLAKLTTPEDSSDSEEFTLVSAPKQHGSPLVHAGRSKSAQKEQDQLLLTNPSLTTPSNFNLSNPEKELLKWHCRLSHLNWNAVKWLMRQGFLATSIKERRLHTAASKLTHGPICTACQYAKQRRKPSPGSTKKNTDLGTKTLRHGDVFPGSCISCDHLTMGTPGRRIESYGKEPDDMKYRKGAVFIDHASGYMYAHPLCNDAAADNLEAKEAFEELCKDHGVVPQQYLSDGGSCYTAAEYKDHIQLKGQLMRLSAPGAHHSNGIAERGIHTITSITRAIMHHAAIHWPEVADETLWPMAVRHAVYTRNRIPREDTGMSPLEMFSRRRLPSSRLRDMHVWGCPAFVLQKSIHSGTGKPPKLAARSERQVYMGNSTEHNHSTPLVLNLKTGKISAQYHVQLDDEFSSVSATNDGQVNFEHDNWYKMFGDTPLQYIPDDDFDHIPDPIPTIEDLDGAARRDRTQAVQDQLELTERNIRQSEGAPSESAHSEGAQPVTAPSEGAHQPEPISHPPPIDSQPFAATTPGSSSPVTSLQRATQPEASQPPSITIDKAPTASVHTEDRQPQKSTRPTASTPKSTVAPRTRSSITKSGVTTRSQAQGPMTRSRSKPKVYRVEDYEWFYDSLYVHKAKSSVNTNPDIMTYEESMASPHRDGFQQAMKDEIDALVEKGTWYEDLKSNCTNKIIPCRWVQRIKRNPIGEVKRLKSRIVLRGDLQEDDGRDNFSPVAAWPTVRMFLVLTLMLGWITTTVDFSNAFVQSYLPDDEPVWMHIPRGFKSDRGPDYCLRLVKSLYGHKRAPQLWFDHSSTAFKKLGLKQSAFDPCLWYGKSLLIVQYVDDCGIAAPNKAIIDKFVKDLRTLGFELTQEESFAEFLGIKFDKKPDGSIHCSQVGLIKKTLAAASMEDCNPVSTPTIMTTLGSDPDGKPMTDPWSPRSICGMLLYLSTNTRPDISFAVSQACRFVNDPKQSHANAIKHILKYLKKTMNEGITIRPQKFDQLKLDMYVDADYCGLHNIEPSESRESARSRGAYIIKLCEWPIVWKTSLIPSICLSTTEAEYVALSDALKTLLPLKELVLEMIKMTKSKPLNNAVIRAEVFEDNQSAFHLANNQRVTGRTKYLNARYHWFWDKYKEDDHLDIVKCPTEEQQADYFTKPLPKELFIKNRFAVQGW